ncbi:aminotransferase [Labrys monachus]|uniref:Aspartate/methionine/tyrosine aminotransferase n=1 Tax=Labrys monachus TaxID=217067 RepID=A0ABU0FEA5_9HYPH|nr:aminotransferase [Labrys monachus]MDQ0392385.1 aspartate/methionine/tyrosine aminotransferase [Labrys monachus]
MNKIFADLQTSVFEAMSLLARETGAINLGQGFPDDPGPEDVRRKAAEAVLSGWNQYPPMMGLPELRRAVAAHYQRFQDVTLDPDSEVMVTSGATEAIADTLMALVEPGDEVVLFQPCYDAYLPLVRRAGGVARFVNLSPPRWRLTREALEAAFSPRTKAVLFNNPLNPAAVVFSDEDLALLAEFCVEHDAVAICDEVWEHVVFDGRRFKPLIGFPGMRERTVKIGSAGKIFSLTGWKVGFVMAAAPILRVIAKAHQFFTFTTPPNLQAAVAYGLGKDEAYFSGMRAGFQRSRDMFAAGLAQAGFRTLPSEATYFINIDLAASGIEEDDIGFCRRLVIEHKVAAIPVSAFYAQDPVTSVVRLCFAKRDDTLSSALANLEGVVAKAVA